jgi:hypothetical protein
MLSSVAVTRDASVANQREQRGDAFVIAEMPEVALHAPERDGGEEVFQVHLHDDRLADVRAALSVMHLPGRNAVAAGWTSSGVRIVRRSHDCATRSFRFGDEMTRTPPRFFGMVNRE